MQASQPDRRRSIASSKRASSRTSGQKTKSTLASDAERRASPGDRRHRERLRELCDEVLASYRAAVGLEEIPAAERAEAERLLAKVAPLPRS